ncbi:hypothetical protein LCGC14_2743120, partial [marine sediment metagenome]
LTTLVVGGAITATGGGSANWNTAYGWGDHASGGYAASSHNHAAADITSGVLAAARISTTTNTVTAAANLSQFNRWGANYDMDLMMTSGFFAGFGTMTNGPTAMTYDPIIVSRNIDTGGQLVLPRTANRPLAYRGWSSSGIFTNWQYTAWGDAPDQIENPMYFQAAVYFGGDTIGHFEAVSGNYGSVQCDGAEGSSGTWRGYSIGGRHVFMDDGINTCGIFNDTENHWLIYCTDQGLVRLYYNNSVKLATTNIGVYITGELHTSGVIELGHTSDTTISRKSAGKVEIENKPIIKHTDTSYDSGEVTFSTSGPTGGNNGDIWFEYTL